MVPAGLANALAMIAKAQEPKNKTAPGAAPAMAPQPQEPVMQLPKPRVAPTLDNSGSNQAFADAVRLLNESQNIPLPQMKKGPNLESILLALVPAAFGAGTNYLGGLTGGYVQGQNQELRRQQALWEQQQNQARQQANAMMDQAGMLRSQEVAKFNQESQNFRNDADNEAMNTRASNALDVRAQDLDAREKRFKLDQAIKAWKSTIDRLIADGNFSDQDRELAQAERERIMTSLGLSADEAESRFFVPPPLKTLAGQRLDQSAELNKVRIADLQANRKNQNYRSALAGAGSILNGYKFDGRVSADEASSFNGSMDDLAAEFKVPRRILPTVSPGESWNVVTGRFNMEMAEAKFDYQKTQDAIKNDQAQQRINISAKNSEIYAKKQSEVLGKELKDLNKDREKELKSLRDDEIMLSVTADGDERKKLAEQIEASKLKIKAIDDERAKYMSDEQKLSEFGRGVSGMVGAITGAGTRRESVKPLLPPADTKFEPSYGSQDMGKKTQQKKTTNKTKLKPGQVRFK